MSPSRVRRSFPDGAYHNRTVHRFVSLALEVPAAKVRPTGEKATEKTSAVVSGSPSRVVNRWPAVPLHRAPPVVQFFSLSIRSPAPPVASRLPSGENARELIHPPHLTAVRFLYPARSQAFTIPSSSPETMAFASGEKATQLTPL